MSAMPDAASESAQCLTYVAPGLAELCAWPRRIAKADGGTGSIELSALYSGISRGTERLVFEGMVPQSEFENMRAPFQKGDFPYPVAYGYAWVGRDERSDQRYFGLFPHQDRATAPASALVELPEALPARRAVLGANMETALNVVWDARAGPGDRIAIVGGGVLGLLIAGLVSDMPGTAVTVIDVDAGRADAAGTMGAAFTTPDAAPDRQDVVIHTSASEAGLATALSIAGTEATVVEASWHGDRKPGLALGEAFHSKRLTLRSSQVGMVSPSRRARWDHRRRLAMALQLLTNAKYDALVTTEVSFESLPKEIGAILAPSAAGLATAVVYDQSHIPG